MSTLIRALLAPTLLLLTACTPIQVAQKPASGPATSSSPATAATPLAAPEVKPPPAAPEIVEEITPEQARRVAAGPLDEPIPPTPGIRSGRFDNGLTYYIRTHRKPEKRAELRLVVNAGSVLEDEDQRGMAHFVEHMAFNGTENFEKQEIVDYLESIGLSFGPDLNAYTSFDETVYMLKVPTDDPAIVEKSLQILVDWAHAVSFDAEEIDKERGVVIEEWRQGRGAGARLRDQQLPILFKDSQYAVRLPIGTRDSLENGTHDALRRFYHDWYRPDLMAVVAVGDFDADAMQAQLEQLFAKIPARENPRPRPDFEVPGHAETLFSIASDSELSRSSVAVHYKHPAEPQGRFRDYRASIVQSLYHGMLNDRLSELTQEAEPPFLYGFSSMSAFVRSSSVFSQQARVRDGEVLSGLETLLTEVERVDRHGFTQSELDRAKTNLERSYDQTNRERDKVRSAPLADELVRAFLEGEPTPGIEVELELVRRFLPTIELDEVNRLAQEWITDENRVIVVNQPEKDELALPTEEAILAVFDGIGERQIDPFVDRVLDAPLLAEIPTPGKIASESQVAELGITEWRLSNGIEVVLKPTDFQNDQIAVSGFSPGGHSLVDDQDHTTAVFATSILGESGLGAFSQIELGKALTGKIAGAQAYINELEEGINAFASPQDIETMFQLLYLRLTEPRLEQKAFDSLIAKLRILVQNRRKNPAAIFGDKLSETLTQGHRRRKPLSEDSLGQIDPEKALEIYRNRFADTSDFTFIFVGNFEPETLKPLVETYLASLPSTRRHEKWRDIGVERPDGVVEFKVEEGLEPKAQVQLIFSGEARWTRENQHQMSSLARALQIRLREILREDLGATYGARVSGNIAWRPLERYTMSVRFGCSPDEIDSLVETVFAEIESLQKNGVEDTYIERIQEIQRRQRETSVKENGFWLGGLQTYYTTGLDPALLLDYDSLVEGVTSQNLQAAAKQYLNPKRYVLGVLSPSPETLAKAAEDEAAASAASGVAEGR
ncbi:MAG: insulinase family protein [Acidobacteriota bacterium]